MKKHQKIALIIAVSLIFAVLLVPIPNVYDDGGTLRLTSLTYTVVFWKRMEMVHEENGEMHIEIMEDVSFHLFPDNFKTASELWESHTEKNS